MNKNFNDWIAEQPIIQNSPYLSIVVPAYNEAKRLPPTLVDMIDYCDQREITYEIIVVDDGSRDTTSEFVNKISRIRSQVKLIRLPRNYGKGHAVRTGVLNATGQKIIFVDADGATPIPELAKLEAALSDETPVVIGSRAMYSRDTVVKTNLHRKIMGRVFNFFVNRFLLPNLADTQCGFKMFTNKAAKYIFEKQQSNQFSFDIEILFIARRAGMKIVEVPINWTNVSGSKVNVVTDSIKMFFDIFRFRILHNSISSDDYEKLLKE